MTRALTLLDSRHHVDLNGVLLGCRWHQDLKFVHLLHKGGNPLHHIIKLKVMHLDGILYVHDGVGPHVQLLLGELQLRTGVVPPVLGLAQEAVHNL
jgi:hypothetical protein